MNASLPSNARTLILATIVTAAAPSASPSTIYSTGFESPIFTVGNALVGQDGWTGVPFLSPGAAMVGNSVVRSGLQALQVRGADMGNAPEVDPLAAVGSFRKPLNYDTAAAGTPYVTIGADVRLDGPVPGGLPDFFAANMAARIGDGFAGELSISSDGYVYGYDGTGDPSHPLLFSAPISLNAWHTLAILVDFSANSFAFSIDGIPTSSFPFADGAVSDVLVRESLITYAYPDQGANHRGDFTAYYDNVFAAAVPEPGCLGMISLGALAWVGCLRRRHSAPM